MPKANPNTSASSSSRLNASARPGLSADPALLRAHELFALQSANRWDVGQTSPARRIAKLMLFERAIHKRSHDLIHAMYEDFRKSRTEVELSEIYPVLSEIRNAIRHLPRWMRSRRVHTPWVLFGTRSELRYDSKGTALILAPWNYPFNLMMSPLVSAIAAGNCVMLRPSDKVPHTGRVMKAMIEDAFPPSEIAMVIGGHEIADALLELPFDHIFFTGSTRMGRKVMAKAAEHLSSVTLELGGKSPAIVDESADLELAAERILWGKFLNAGQTCLAPDYCFVHFTQIRPFAQACRKVIQRFLGSDESGWVKNPDFCRIVDETSFRRLRSTLRATIDAGAKLEFGGMTDPSQRYLSPTLLTQVRPDFPIMNEEIFGPILPVLAYHDAHDVVEHVRANGQPLALYVFSEKRDNAEFFLRNAPAGGSCVNNVMVHFGNPELPFGGVGTSGQGTYHGHEGFRAFSHERAVLTQSSPNLTKIFYPPYETPAQRIMTRVMRFLA